MDKSININIFMGGIFFTAFILFLILLNQNVGWYMFLFITSTFFVSYIFFNQQDDWITKIFMGFIFSLLFGFLYLGFSYITFFFLFLIVKGESEEMNTQLVTLFILGIISIFSLLMLQSIGSDFLFLIGLGFIIFIWNYFLQKEYEL